MAGFHTSVRMSGFEFEPYQFTAKLAVGITTADIGKAVTPDNTAANTVKLAGDGDPICGQLQAVENRVNESQLVGTVTFHFATKLPIKAGLAGANVVAIGSHLCGAGAGEVKAIDMTGTPSAATISMHARAPRCWEVQGTLAIATKF